MHERHGEYRCVRGRWVASPEYYAWCAMRRRCLNPRHPWYKRYGGRGITITKRWNSFPNFLEDMGRRPSALHTLERKNNNGHYCKRNCYWATRLEQSRNRVNNICTLAKARKIRKLHSTGRYLQRELGKQFNLDRVYISYIVRNKIWVDKCA